MKLDGSATEGSIRCPECDENFMTLVKLHTHAVNTHYYSQLKSLLQPHFKVNSSDSVMSDSVMNDSVNSDSVMNHSVMSDSVTNDCCDE
jgi:hypothetical protein